MFPPNSRLLTQYTPTSALATALDHGRCSNALALLASYPKEYAKSASLEEVLRVALREPAVLRAVLGLVTGWETCGVRLDHVLPLDGSTSHCPACLEIYFFFCVRGFCF